jgi:CRP/FNR family transcriptional regulator, cyclic AMP receptor protein
MREGRRLAAAPIAPEAGSVGGFGGMDKQALVDALRDVRFLHDIDNEHLSQIAELTRLRDAGEGEILFREGDTPADVFLVVSGRVGLDINTPGMGERRIMDVGPGEILGWSALLEQTQMTATARTLCPSSVAQINTGELLRICKRNPRFGYELLRRTSLALASRLSATRHQLLDSFGSQMPPGM